MNDLAYQQCVDRRCNATYTVNDVVFACRRCGSLLDVRYEWDRVPVPKDTAVFSARRAAASSGPDGPADRSGVWRFRELLPFADPRHIVTVGEGQTILQRADALAAELGCQPGSLYLQYEGLNPSGSFKDNGMTAAFTVAGMLGRRRVACASTGNTSASMAMFASAAARAPGDHVQAIVFVGGGKIARGKLSQALDYGALTLQIDGDFDACMRRVLEATDRLGLYLVNSVNPFRLEGQKTIMYRVLEGLNWEVPDWIVVPGGNLGNTSAFGKAFAELHELGLIDRRPRIAVINATGANALYELYEQHGLRWYDGDVDRAVVEGYFAQRRATGWRAQTVASAIEIGEPVNLAKALRTLATTDGVVRQVDDAAILEHKALVGRFGMGCEPASAASVAGLRLLLEEQVVSPGDRVVCILTGHQLKDPEATVGYHLDASGKPPRAANPPVPVRDDLDEICRVLDERRA